MDPSPTPKIARYGPKMSKITPKLSQNQMSELKETKKMKVVQLHESCATTWVDPKSVVEP